MHDLQKEPDKKRKLYMNHELSHEEFYLWLAGAIGIREYDLPVSKCRIQASTDEHLNDISLRLWDSMDPMIRRKAYLSGMSSWSLSDTVCTLKAFRLHIAQQHGESL